MYVCVYICVYIYTLCLETCIYEYQYVAHNVFYVYRNDKKGLKRSQSFEKVMVCVKKSDIISFWV